MAHRQSHISLTIRHGLYAIIDTDEIDTGHLSRLVNIGVVHLVIVHVNLDMQMELN